MPISTAWEAEASSVPTGGLTLSMPIEDPGEGVTLVSSSECMLYFTCFWSLAVSWMGAVTGLPHLLAKYRVIDGLVGPSPSRLRFGGPGLC